MKCFICEEEFNKRHGRHIHLCAREHGLTVSKDELRFRQICYETGVDFTRELMDEWYVARGCSLPDLEREFGLTEGHPLHGEPGLDQFFAWRPLLGQARYRLAIPRGWGHGGAARIAHGTPMVRDGGR